MNTTRLAILSGWVARIISASAQLIAIRYVMLQLGEEGFGAFALLAALASWAVLMDFGIGSTLQNYISEARAYGMGYGDLIRKSALYLVPIGIFLSACVLAMANSLATHYLTNIYIFNQEQKTYATASICIIFIWTTIGGVSYKVFFAEHRGWIANLLPAIGALIGLGGIWAIDVSGYNNPLAAILTIYYAPPALLAILTSLYLLAKISNNKKTPTPQMVTRNRLFFGRAFNFWTFSSAAAFVLQADYWVISQKLRPQEIIIYTVALKVFGLFLFLYSAALQATWPVFSELIAKNKITEVQYSIRKYLIGGLILSTGFFLFFFFFKESIYRFMKSDQEISSITLVLLSIYLLLRIWTDTYAMVLQSANIMRPFWILVPMQAAISIGAQWVLSGQYGLNGIILGVMISFITTVSPGLFFVYQRKFSSANAI